MPIDRKQLPQSADVLQQMVLDLIAQLDAEQARRIKTENLLRQLLAARSGRRALPGHLKLERIVHDLEEAEKHCSICEQDLRELGEETSERYEYIPAQLIVIEDVSKKYSCSCTVKTAGKPSQPIEKSTAGASLLTQVIVAKFADHLPLHRQAKIFRRLGVELSDRTMCGWKRQSADLLDPL